MLACHARDRLCQCRELDPSKEKEAVERRRRPEMLDNAPDEVEPEQFENRGIVGFNGLVSGVDELQRSKFLKVLLGSRVRRRLCRLITCCND